MMFPNDVGVVGSNFSSQATDELLKPVNLCHLQTSKTVDF